MPTTTGTRAALVLAVLALTIVGCGSGGGSDAATVESDPATVTTTTTSSDPPATATVPPSTSASPSSTTTPDAAREAAPPLGATTELLVDGVSALPDVAIPRTHEPGRYHSSRLGTEIVFDVPEPFGLGNHEAAFIAFDSGPDRILAITRYSDTGTLAGPDAEPLSSTEWIDELLASDWEVQETDWPDISGNAVRRFDVTATGPQPILGSGGALGPLVFELGTLHRVWFIDQPDGHPIVVFTKIVDDAWAETTDTVVGSIQLGPGQQDPRIGREPIEYGGPFWSIEQGSSYRTLLFGSAVLTAPVDLVGIAAAQHLSVRVPGDHDGLEQPSVVIAAADGFADAADLFDHLATLADQGLISPLRQVDEALPMLGATLETVEFDVPDGGEVLLFVSQPDGWSHLSIETLRPARTHRISIGDIDQQVAVAIVRADRDVPTDLDAGTAFLETLAAGFHRS